MCFNREILSFFSNCKVKEVINCRSANVHNTVLPRKIKSLSVVYCNIMFHVADAYHIDRRCLLGVYVNVLAPSDLFPPVSRYIYLKYDAQLKTVDQRSDSSKLSSNASCIDWYLKGLNEFQTDVLHSSSFRSIGTQFLIKNFDVRLCLIIFNPSS